MILEVKDACFAYPGDGRHIFKNVSFKLKKSDFMCILGPNGSGKSTLLSCIAGILKLTSGSVLVKGNNILEQSRKLTARTVGIMHQAADNCPDYKVSDIVSMGRFPYMSIFDKPGKTDELVIANSLDKIGILHLKDKIYSHLSGGEKQMVMLARVLAQEPECILMDEPTASLDFGNQDKVVELARNLAVEGYCVIMTTHNPSHALKAGGTAGIMDKSGNFTAGMVEEMITEPILSKLYGTAVKMKYIEEFGQKVCITV